MKVEKVSVEDRQLENLEDRIASLTEELTDIKNKIKREHKHVRLRKLREQAHFLENEIAYYNRQIRQISESYFDCRSRQ